jgi:Holliday junction resolvase-like predicted endonuclease
LCLAQSSQFGKSFRSLSQECEIRHIPGTNPRLGESDQAFRPTGRRGEPDAYFHLRRRLGYVIVARNHRAPRQPGEIKLIGRSAEVPGFIEVKTRTSRDGKTPEAAVDRHKRREVAAAAREYLRRQPPPATPATVGPMAVRPGSVYYAQSSARQPPIEVFRNAPLSA